MVQAVFRNVGLDCSHAKPKHPSLPAHAPLVLSRDAAEEEEGAGHVGGLRPRGGELGWLEAPGGQSHPGAPVGAGEDGAAARGASPHGGGQGSLKRPVNHSMEPHMLGSVLSTIWIQCCDFL